MTRRPFTARARGLIARQRGRMRALVPGIPRSRREAEVSLLAVATLREEGWHRAIGGAPTDRAGNAVPWLSYSAVRWLDTVLGPGVRVFEYGAGASTTWFARPGRVGEIVSVEHDAAWFAQLSQPGNGEIRHVPCHDGWWDGPEDSPYVQAIADGGPWDVVVVDGSSRTTCARIAPEHLTPSGLVILDDTDLSTTEPAAKELARHGLGRIDFWGFKPGVTRMTCTSAFSWDFNHWLLPKQTPASRPVGVPAAR